jgi:hypothetical protein
MNNFHSAVIIFLTVNGCAAGNNPSDELVRTRTALVNRKYGGAFLTNLQVACEHLLERRVVLSGTASAKSLVALENDRIKDARDISLVVHGVDLSSELTVELENTGIGLNTYLPCLQGPAWGRLLIPASTLVYDVIWNPHFVQRPGGAYRLWVNGSSRPTVSGILRIRESGVVSYRFYLSEEVSMPTRSDYLEIRDADTGTPLPCVLPPVGPAFPLEYECGSAAVPRTRIELRGVTGKTGQPLLRPDGSAPVFHVDWEDSQQVDGVGWSTVLWHEELTPP